ncbi:unnamed protein product [Gadus morhua 'NCC']
MDAAQCTVHSGGARDSQAPPPLPTNDFKKMLTNGNAGIPEPMSRRLVRGEDCSGTSEAGGAEGAGLGYGACLLLTPAEPDGSVGWRCNYPS